MVAIIAALMSLTLPALSRSIAETELANDQANMRQHYILLMTADDNKRMLPRVSARGRLNLDIVINYWYGADLLSYQIVNPVIGLYTDDFSFLRCSAIDIVNKGDTVNSNVFFF